jgi:hypothetical protein
MTKNQIHDIESLEDLNNLELQLKKIFTKMNLGDVLYSLYQLRQNQELPDFIVAGVALLAIRFCPPSNPYKKIGYYQDIGYLVDLCWKYLSADPITFDKQLESEFIKSNPVFMLLRLACNQFPFRPYISSQFARAIILFDEIPKTLVSSSKKAKFDLEKKFNDINGVSLFDFIFTGFCIYTFIHKHFYITRDCFRQYRKQGIHLRDDRIISKVLDQLSGDKFSLLQQYESSENIDNRFRMYDLNPLLKKPIIKPCHHKQIATPDRDFFHAPVPDLIASRISSGVFYQMCDHYGEDFSKYFGYVFEQYVGIILKNCLTSELFLSEEEIRVFYPTNKGKAPDWIIVDGSTLLIFECKATRFTLQAKTIASEEHINSSLKQVKKGLEQLASFISACQSKVGELQRFHDCNNFIPVFVSLEPLYLINSDWFREYINDLLLRDKGIILPNWRILSIENLEILQPHISSQYTILNFFDDFLKKSLDNTLQEIIEQSDKDFSNSFLYSKYLYLYEKLGVREKIEEKFNKF